MSKKSFASVTQDALAAATAHALSKVSPKAVTTALVPFESTGESERPAQSTASSAPHGSEKTIQWNVRLKPHLREKLRNCAFAWRMTERDLVEAFIEQLPNVEVPNPVAPASVAWAKQ